MVAYIGVIHKEAKSDFGVSFPDFPGCITAGSTLEEAMDMAREALALHIEGMQEDKQTIPEPSTLKQLKTFVAHQNGVAVVVDAPIKSKMVRVNVMLDENLLHRIDAKTSNRSAFLAEAARESLRQE